MSLPEGEEIVDDIEFGSSKAIMACEFRQKDEIKSAVRVLSVYL